MVEKVADTEQPGYGNTEPRGLTKDASKCTADAEPDFEVITEDTPTSVEPSILSEKPRVVVEKTDDKLSYGDDFGDNATISQRVAHDMRAADAAPNKLVITPECYTEPVIEEGQDAPLFRHESFQSEGQLPSTPALDTIDEVSTQSSTDHPSSEDLTHSPLPSHETGLEDDDFDELNHGPLLSHETGMNGDIHSSDDDVDELDAAPLLPHETGFSQYKSSESATYSDYMEDDISEPRLYMHNDDDEDEARPFDPDQLPTFTHEDAADSDCDEVDDTPLLPHERDFAIADSSSPEESGGFTLRQQPTFDYEDGPARALFGGRGRPGIFRARSNSSNLPHNLPKTDEEDENLADPSLERFPTRRDQILDRVATIGLHLPEDEPMDDQVHSPVMSVLSQACSSVDLAPVKSYTSLASVPEADDSDEEIDGDVDSLPSPMIMNFSSASTAFARYPHATPMPNNGRQLGHTEVKASQASSDHDTGAGDVDSGGKTGGAKETLLDKLHDTITTPNKVLNPITPPLMPDETITSMDKEGATQVSGPHLRQRQMPKEDDSEANQAVTPRAQEQEDDSDHAVTSSDNQQLAHDNETILQTFFRIVFGSIGRFLTVCVGDRKRAG